MYTFCYRVYQSVASQKNRNHSRQNKQRRSEGQELVTKVVKGLKHKRQKERAPLERREGRTVSRTSEAALPRVGGGGGAAVQRAEPPPTSTATFRHPRSSATARPPPQGKISSTLLFPTFYFSCQCQEMTGLNRSLGQGVWETQPTGCKPLRRAGWS